MVQLPQATSVLAKEMGTMEWNPYRYKQIWEVPKIGVGPPKSSILIVFSLINHPFWGTPIFGNTHIAESPGNLEESCESQLLAKSITAETYDPYMSLHLFLYLWQVLSCC